MGKMEKEMEEMKTELARIADEDESGSEKESEKGSEEDAGETQTMQE